MNAAYVAAAVVGLTLGSLVLLMLALTLCVAPAQAVAQWDTGAMALLGSTLAGRVLYLEGRASLSA